MSARATFAALCALTALGACSFDAPSPFGGEARVNGAPLSDTAANALDRTPPRTIVVEAPGCDRKELIVDGSMDAENVVAALSAMGVIEATPGALIVRGGEIDLAAFGDQLRCRRGGQATTSASLDFEADDGVSYEAVDRFDGIPVEDAPRFQSIASPAGGDAPINAGTVRPGSGLFRAQLGVYDSYPEAVAAWRELLRSSEATFRGEPVVVQPFAGSYRLNVLRRSLASAEAYCRDAKLGGALVCITGAY